jgi:predicted RNA-binding protein with PUA-like domain
MGNLRPIKMLEFAARKPSISLRNNNMKYWLMKSEPDAYSIDDLERDGRDMWDGIRNYQARNMMRDDMKIGDEIFFYHSNCDEPGIVGIAKVASEPYPDPTQFDKKSKYFDPKSSKDDPRWCLVDVEFLRKTKRNVTLTEIKAQKSLDDMILTRKGNRLSIMPVSKKHWNKILSIE